MSRNKNPVTDKPIVLSNSCVRSYFITTMSPKVDDKKIQVVTIGF
jgi:hypothetical protein